MTVAALPPSAGGRPSLAVIYRDQHAFVWRSLRRLGVPERELPDATHDVFVAVHRRLPEYDAASRITTWLYAFCLRVASQRRRRASERYERLDEPSLEPARLDADLEARRAELTDRRRLLERALDAMSLDQRAVFVLFAIEGWEGDEIAAALAVPVATVHSRLRLARGVFRKTLARATTRDEFAHHRSEVRE